MPTALPPFAIAVPTFRFRAIAMAAGRAPLGGPRELTLACYVGARLALPLSTAEAAEVLEDDVRAARAAGARAWLASAALPSEIRAALARLYDATAVPLEQPPAPTAASRRGRATKRAAASAHATTTPLSRQAVAMEVAAALAAVVMAAEHLLEPAARQELVRLCRDLDPTLDPARRAAPRGEPSPAGR